MAVRNSTMLRGIMILAASACLAGIAAPAYAQAAPEAEIDRLIDASKGTDSAMALARRQIAEGDLIAAAATLERLLVDHPEVDDALLLHASLLCRLDDVPGARSELSAVKAGRGSEQAWGEVRAACGPVPQARRN